MKALRIARTIVGISVRELAATANVSEREVRRIERGSAVPHFATLKRLDDALSSIINERCAHGVQHA